MTKDCQFKRETNNRKSLQSLYNNAFTRRQMLNILSLAKIVKIVFRIHKIVIRYRNDCRCRIYFLSWDLRRHSSFKK